VLTLVGAPAGTPPPRPTLDSRAGLVSSTHPQAGATKVMISRVQAFKRHARQEAASAIAQSPEGQDASEAKIGCQAA
jgi:hypothetical protein